MKIETCFKKINTKGGRNMFDFLKDMLTVAKTDIDLALLKKDDAGANTYEGIANEGFLISKIEDEITSLDAMNALKDRIDGKEVPEHIGEMITKATMVIEFLRASGYTDDQIQKIGYICNQLERNGGTVSDHNEISETDIVMAIDAYNKYMASIGCPPKWVINLTDAMSEPAITVENKKEEKKTTSPSKSTKKASANAKKEPEMVKPFTVPVTAGAK